MGQLRAFGAVVGPKSTPCAKQEAEGFEISQMDVDDAERGILYESVYVESAEFFGVYPGFAMDLHGMSQIRKQAFKFRETMRPKLLVGPPERKTWNQSQNLSKDKELFVVKCTHVSRQRQLRTCTPDRWTTTTTSFMNIPKRQFFQHKVFS